MWDLIVELHGGFDEFPTRDGQASLALEGRHWLLTADLLRPLLREIAVKATWGQEDITQAWEREI
jgi:hypothetical protein